MHILENEGRKSLDTKVERFWNVWTSNWQGKLENGHALYVSTLLGGSSRPYVHWRLLTNAGSSSQVSFHPFLVLNTLPAPQSSSLAPSFTISPPPPHSRPPFFATSSLFFLPNPRQHLKVTQTQRSTPPSLPPPRPLPTNTTGSVSEQ